MISAFVANYCQVLFWKKLVLFVMGAVLLFGAQLVRNLIALVACNLDSDSKIYWMYNEPGDLLLIVFVVVGLSLVSRVLRFPSEES